MRKERNQLNVPAGHVAFRLLATSSDGKAVIGRNGVVHQRIIRQTGALNIRVADAVPECGERVVHVIGTATVDRTVAVKDERGGGEIKFQVSAAQAAVVRVLEVVEAEQSAKVAINYDFMRMCRLLVVAEVEVAKRDAALKRIEVDSGAFVRVLPPAMVPPCADPSDELIQITGASLAVKKALIAVTNCLQKGRSTLTRSHNLTSSAPSRDLPLQKDMCHAMESRESHNLTSSAPTRDLLVQKDICHSMESRESGQSCIPNLDTREVAFRLVCPAQVSGSSVGWDETVINDLEEETGASVQVSPTVAWPHELIITVSAMESKDLQYSPAQNAAACVFLRSMKDGDDAGSGSGFVMAKLLIPFNQADIEDLTSDLQNTKVQMLDHNLCPSADDKLLQIVGELSDVHVDLFQVTWKLREKIFAVKLPGINACLLPHEILRRPPCINQNVGITETMDRLALSDGVKDVPKVRASKFSPGAPLAITPENQNGFEVLTSGSSSEFGSDDGYAFVKNTELEIVIPANAFGRVYGKDGCNMARVREISGATVIIHDPSPGTDGKALISGKPNRTQAAMSMLLAFINEKNDHNH